MQDSQAISDVVLIIIEGFDGMAFMQGPSTAFQAKKAILAGKADISGILLLVMVAGDSFLRGSRFHSDAW
jgi:hypothetical protein